MKSIVREPPSRVLGLGLALWGLMSMVGCSGGGGSDAAIAPGGPQADSVAPVAGLRCSGPGGTGWCWQSPQPWGHLIRDVVFVDASVGFAVGDGGALLVTRDGGLGWEERFLPGAPSLQAIRFSADGRRGWLAGRDNARLWRSADGGATWLDAPPLPLRHVQSLELAPDGALLLRGDREVRALGFEARISADSGDTWRDPGPRLVALDVDGAQWHVADEGGVLRSTDGGLSWSRPAAWPAGAVADSVVVGEGGRAWARLFQPEIHRVRLGAHAPWTEVALPLPRVSGLWFGVEGAWTFGADGGDNLRLWHAGADGGSWLEVARPDPAVRSLVVDVIDGRSAWARGYAPDWSHWVTSDAGASWVRVPTFDGDGRNQPSRLLRDSGGGLLAAADGRPGDYQTPAAWFRSTDQGRNWTVLPGRHAGQDPLLALVMVDARRGLAVSATGRALETDDGGRVWRQGTRALEHLGQFSQRVDLQVTADGSTWLLDDGRIRRSGDGGRTWVDLPLPADLGASERPWSLQMLDARSAFLVTASKCDSVSGTFVCSHQLWVSDDGGQHWSSLGSAIGPGAVWMGSRSSGVRESAGGYQYTTDGGLSWTAATISGAMPSGELQRVTSGAGAWWALLGGGLLRSTDQGRSWAVLTVPAPPVWDPVLPGSTALGPLLDLAFADERQGWIVGIDGLVLATTDGGLTWQRQASGTGMDLLRIHARSPQAVWVAGAYGSILATATAGR